MKTLVAVTSAGEICCLTPLYPIVEAKEVGTHAGYTMSLVAYDDKPLAYVLDAGDELNKQFSNKGPTLLAARFIEPHVEILGEL